VNSKTPCFALKRPLQAYGGKAFPDAQQHTVTDPLIGTLFRYVIKEENRPRYWSVPDRCLTSGDALKVLVMRKGSTTELSTNKHRARRLHCTCVFASVASDSGFGNDSIACSIHSNCFLPYRAAPYSCSVL